MTHNAMLQAEVTRLRKSRTEKLVSTAKPTGMKSHALPAATTERAMSTESESHHPTIPGGTGTVPTIRSEKSMDSTGSFDTSNKHYAAYASGSSKALLRAMQAGSTTKTSSVPARAPPIDAHELFAQLNDVLSDESLRLLLSYLENYHSGNLSIDSFLTRAQVVRVRTLIYTYAYPYQLTNTHTHPPRHYLYCLFTCIPNSSYLKQQMLGWQLNYMHSWSSSFVSMLPLLSCAMYTYTRAHAQPVSSTLTCMPLQLDLLSRHARAARHATP